MLIRCVSWRSVSSCVVLLCFVVLRCVVLCVLVVGWCVQLCVGGVCDVMLCVV